MEEDEDVDGKLKDEHIIIDGQVHLVDDQFTYEEYPTTSNDFDDSNEIKSKHLLDNDVDDVDDNEAMFITGDETEFGDNDEAQYIETENGPVRLVQIRMPKSSNENDSMSWVDVNDD